MIMKSPALERAVETFERVHGPLVPKAEHTSEEVRLHSAIRDAREAEQAANSAVSAADRAISTATETFRKATTLAKHLRCRRELLEQELDALVESQDEARARLEALDAAALAGGGVA
jgi:chromosome segregation ATPase